MSPTALHRPTLLGSIPAFDPAEAAWRAQRRAPVSLAQAPAMGLSAVLANSAVSRAADSSLATVRRVRAASSPAATAKPAERRVRPLVFEYSGHGSISIMSSITGRHYRFSAHGERIEVDARDGAQLARVPQLTQL